MTYVVEKITREELREALVKHEGNLSAIARAYDMRRSSVKSRVDTDAELRGVYEDITEELLDCAEQNVKVAVVEGDVKTSRWLLATKGKHRGYGSSLALSDPDGEPLHTGAMDRLTALINNFSRKDGTVDQAEAPAPVEGSE